MFIEVHDQYSTLYMNVNLIEHVQTRDFGCLIYLAAEGYEVIETYDEVKKLIKEQL